MLNLYQQIFSFQALCCQDCWHELFASAEEGGGRVERVKNGSFLFNLQLILDKFLQ